MVLDVTTTCNNRRYFQCEKTEFKQHFIIENIKKKV